MTQIEPDRPRYLSWRSAQTVTPAVLYELGAACGTTSYPEFAGGCVFNILSPLGTPLSGGNLYPSYHLSLCVFLLLCGRRRGKQYKRPGESLGSTRRAKVHFSERAAGPPHKISEGIMEHISLVFLKPGERVARLKLRTFSASHRTIVLKNADQDGSLLTAQSMSLSTSHPGFHLRWTILRYPSHPFPLKGVNTAEPHRSFGLSFVQRDYFRRSKPSLLTFSMYRRG